MKNVEKLIKMIEESNSIVAFTGAGVSTDSGLKDFRSKDGLYNEDNEYPAEYLLSSECFYRHPNIFYEYYKKNFNCLKYEPNDTHKLLKVLEDKKKLKAIITQNIDGLHTKAGSNIVYEVHGTIYKNHCIECHKEYEANYIFEAKDIPKCACKGIIKPNVVLYGESLPEDAFTNGIKAISQADMLIVMGSSLTVYPASSMLNHFKGKYLVIINRDKTPFDYKADLIINDNLAIISNKIINILEGE